MIDRDVYSWVQYGSKVVTKYLLLFTFLFINEITSFHEWYFSSNYCSIVVSWNWHSLTVPLLVQLATELSECPA